MESVKHFRLEDLLETPPPGGPVGITLGNFRIGDPTKDPAVPNVAVARWEPGAAVAPHSHPTDYVEIILEGSQKVGKRWHRRGDARLVRAGTGYGPLIAGPEGCMIMVIFANGAGGIDWLPSETIEPKFYMTSTEEVVDGAPAAAEPASAH